MKTEIIPVIHMINRNQVLTNVKTCLECDIKKIFLINHQVSIEDLLSCASYIKSLYPDLWVGINMLGTTTEESISQDIPVDGIWCDATITPENSLKLRKFKGLFFGGLAFKYQPQPTDLKLACEESCISTDVSTTSGPGTGKQADINKIKMIREYLGSHPMGIASGVSCNNISDYKDVVEYLIVASSITSTGEMILKDKLIELKNKI